MKLFPTTVVGSLPRPEWLRELILDRKEGRISEEEATPHLDRAAAMAISLQERTGLDEVTDGEWRRESYVKVFAERVRGFRNDLNLSNIPYPAVVEPIEYYQPIAAEEVAFARPRTTRRLKITLPAPYIIGRRMWHPDHSRDAYPRREDLMEAVVPILRQEIEAVRAAGADVVQLDEPWLSVMVDPEFRAGEGIGDPEPEMERCIDLLNRTLDGVSGIDTAMHLCHAHFQHRHSTSGSYDPIMPALARARVGTILMEYATPDAGGIDSLAAFPKDARLGLGCVDHCNETIESPETIVARVEAAMRYVDKERIVLNPDCGFAPSVQNPIPVDEAYLKLKAMCAAAEQLRQRHPG